MTGDRLNGVATGDGEVHLARLTIDATGRRAWLAHALGIAPDPRSPPLYATFGWTSQAGVIGCSEPELATRADGWHWAAPVGGGERAGSHCALARPGMAPTRVSTSVGVAPMANGLNRTSWGMPR